MSSRHLRRWLVAIVMIVGIAATGAGRSGSPAPAGGEPPAALTASASAWSGTQGIMPVQPHIEAASAYERGVRVKLPVLVGAVAAAAVAAVAVSRGGFRRHQRSRVPLALRALSLPGRAPPLLPLG